MLYVLSKILLKISHLRVNVNTYSRFYEKVQQYIKGGSHVLALVKGGLFSPPPADMLSEIHRIPQQIPSLIPFLFNLKINLVRFISHCIQLHEADAGILVFRAVECAELSPLPLRIRG